MRLNLRLLPTISGAIRLSDAAPSMDAIESFIPVLWLLGELSHSVHRCITSMRRYPTYTINTKPQHPVKMSIAQTLARIPSGI
jgi:hypothetical protein